MLQGVTNPELPVSNDPTHLPDPVPLPGEPRVVRVFSALSGSPDKPTLSQLESLKSVCFRDRDHEVVGCWYQRDPLSPIAWTPIGQRCLFQTPYAILAVGEERWIVDGRLLSIPAATAGAGVSP
jgi:hypothetical protein